MKICDLYTDIYFVSLLVYLHHMRIIHNLRSIFTKEKKGKLFIIGVIEIIYICNT